MERSVQFQSLMYVTRLLGELILSTSHTAPHCADRLMLEEAPLPAQLRGERIDNAFVLVMY